MNQDHWQTRGHALGGGQPAWLADEQGRGPHQICHVGGVTEHPIAVALEGGQALDLAFELVVPPTNHHSLEVAGHSHGLLHDRLRVRAACGTRRDQQDGPIRPQLVAPQDSLSIDGLGQTQPDRYSRDRNPIGRYANGGHIGLGLLARNEEVVERTGQPQSLEVVVGGNNGELCLEYAASQHE